MMVIVSLAVMLKAGDGRHEDDDHWENLHGLSVFSAFAREHRHSGLGDI
jgi:hypothetical protein